MFGSSSIQRLPLIRVGAALALLFSLALALFPSHFSLAQDPTETDASVRFVQASPDAPAVDVVIDGAVVASNIAFGEASDAVSISPDSHQLQFVPAGSDAASALVDTTIDLEGGETAIVAASGLLKEIEAKVYEVDKGDLDSGQSRLRLINLSPEDANVDFAVTGGDTLFDDLAFGDSSDYTDLDAGSYDFEVRPHDQQTTSMSVSGFQVDEGNAYDLLLLGTTADNNLSVIPLTTPVSTPCSTVLGIGTPADACVRVANASPDASPVDIYVNDSLLVEDLAYGVGTNFTALAAGDDRELKFVPAGGNVDDALFTTSVDLDAGKAYDVVAVGMANDLDAIFEPADLSAVPDGQVRLRFIHTAPDVDGVDMIITDGPTLFDDVGFKDTTDYETLDAGTYDIQIKQGDDVLIRIQDFTLEPGKVYNAMLLGREDDKSLQLVAFSSAAEAPSGGTAGSTLGATPATIEDVTPVIVASPAA